MAKIKKTKKELELDAAVTAAFTHKSDSYDDDEMTGVPFGDGFSLIHDRQGRRGDLVFLSEQGQTMLNFINVTILPVLRRKAYELYADDGRFYHFSFLSPVYGQVKAVISPRASHGYIYGCVYLPLAVLSPAPAPAAS
jgi:hypothetical protein